MHVSADWCIVHRFRSPSTCLHSLVHVWCSQWEKKKMHVSADWCVVHSFRSQGTCLLMFPCSCFGAHDVRRKRCVRLQIGALCTALGHRALVYLHSPVHVWCSRCEKKKMHVSADRCVVHSFRSQGTCYLRSRVHVLVLTM